MTPTKAMPAMLATCAAGLLLMHAPLHAMQTNDGGGGRCEDVADLVDQYAPDTAYRAELRAACDCEFVSAAVEDDPNEAARDAARHAVEPCQLPHPPSHRG